MLFWFFFLFSFWKKSEKKRKTTIGNCIVVPATWTTRGHIHPSSHSFINPSIYLPTVFPLRDHRWLELILVAFGETLSNSPVYNNIQDCCIPFSLELENVSLYYRRNLEYQGGTHTHIWGKENHVDPRRFKPRMRLTTAPPWTCDLKTYAFLLTEMCF